jgi:hypothetical protein
MAQIYNSDLTKELVAGAKLQQSREKVPQELAEKVVPVMEVNPRLLRKVNLIKGSAAAAGGNVTMYTTPTDKDFYLTYANLSMSKIVTDSNDYLALVIAIPGFASAAVLNLCGTTLKVENMAVSQCFEPPILLTRGSTLVLTKNAANSSTCCCIGGYTVDNVNI